MKRSWHIYRAKTEIYAHAIGKKGWVELEECDEAKAMELKQKIVQLYLRNVRQLLKQAKEKDLAELKKMEHTKQNTLVLDEIKDDEIDEILKDLYSQEDEENEIE